LTMNCPFTCAVPVTCAKGASTAPPMLLLRRSEVASLKLKRIFWAMVESPLGCWPSAST